METVTLMLRYPLKQLKSVAKYLAGLEPEFFRYERGTVTPKQMLERAKKAMGMA
jgi:4-hydroxyphenylacetate 3-monooxygenase/4-hydroxybutyryl-CoA dehydratase/vinylacetyl-CoA-Delta-isomerase